MQSFEVWTDGSCDPNPGAGGWGAVIVEKGKEPVEIWGADPETTNNRMELLACIEALEAIMPSAHVTIHCDSKYVVRGASEWKASWKRRGWRRRDASKKDRSACLPLQNADLWERLDNAERHHKSVEWVWVKGHAGTGFNELAHQLAEKARCTGEFLDAPCWMTV